MLRAQEVGEGMEREKEPKQICSNFFILLFRKLLFASHTLGMEMACHKGLPEGSLLRGLRKTISIINPAVPNPAVLIDTGSQVVSYCLAI